MAEVGFDVAVIGGGPAGSTLAAYLAKADMSVIVFEDRLFPRPHVGESLVPAATPVLAETGALAKVDAAGFPRKYGAAWTSGIAADGAGTTARGGSHNFRSAAVRFSERDQPGVDRNYTYHVDRSKFDNILLQHAESLGATVAEGIRVHNIDFDDTGVTISSRLGGGTWPVRARLVVDASGRMTVLGSKLGLKVMDPVFNQYAIHTWFDRFDRKLLAVDPEQADYIFIHFLPDRNTWVWPIPITDTITSVGVVTQKHTFLSAKADQAQFFWDAIATRPELHEALRAAERATPFRTEGDYSYAMKQMCGTNFVLIGDAARFVDPIFSSGVSVAVNSARFAAQDILDAAHTGAPFGPEAFTTYVKKIRCGMRNWYEFISLYYRLNVLYTRFMHDPRYRLDIIKLLQGDVYDDEAPQALAAMRKIVTTVENNPDHLWHRHLGTLRVPSAVPVF
jgi:flavin-dependent dehydrogenase